MEPREVMLKQVVIGMRDEKTTAGMRSILTLYQDRACTSQHLKRKGGIHDHSNLADLVAAATVLDAG